jgi:ATP-dependent protease ClpP protease subunit
MSKTKNTEEFRQMMEDQEMAAAFDFQEKEALQEEIAVQHAIERAVDEYIKAQKVFIEAQNKFSKTLEAYKNYKGGLTHEEEKVSTTIDTLNNMFQGFNPNDI